PAARADGVSTISDVSDPAPSSAVAGQQLVRFRWSPGARLVVREVRRWTVGPGLDDRRDDAPRLLDLVRPREQRGVAEKCVENEGLVGIRRVDAERRAVREVHVHRPDVDPKARDLRAEPEEDALVGL